jgi:protein ImuB
VSTSGRLCEIARDISPRIEQRGVCWVILDVDGLGRLYGDLKAVGEHVRRTAVERGIAPVHVSIAATRTAAILLAVARPGVTVVLPGQHAAAVAPLPLRLLEVCAAASTPHSRVPAPEALSRFFRWGLRTLGDLAALPSIELSERLGQSGLIWQRLARGEDADPFVPAPEDDPFETSCDLEWPIADLEPLSFVLGRLLDPLCQRLAQRDRAAAVLHVRLRLVTKDIYARRLQLPAPMRDPKVLRTLLLLDLESHPAPAGIDAVTIAIEPTPGRIVQESLFVRAQPAPEQISTLLARLQALMGERRSGAPALMDSWRPGAFTMVPFRVPLDSRTPHVASPSSKPIDSGMAGNHARLSPVPRTVLRRFRRPIPARVLIDEGCPFSVRTDRDSVPGGRVQAWAGPWRTSGEWWKVPGIDCSNCLSGRVGWDRDEWDVALSDGGLYRIFEDRESGRWFVEAIVD